MENENRAGMSMKVIYDSMIQPLTAVLVLGVFILTLYYNGVYVPKNTYEKDKEKREIQDTERSAAFQKVLAEMRTDQIKQTEATLAETRLNRQAIENVNLTIVSMKTQAELAHDHELRIRELEKGFAGIKTPSR